MARRFSRGNTDFKLERGRLSWESDNGSKTGSFNLLGLILVVLLACSVVAILGAQDGEPKTFYGFLQMLQEVPSMDVSWLTFVVQYDIPFPDWLAWLNPVIDFFLGFLSVGAFLITGILQALAFIVYILGWILA